MPRPSFLSALPLLLLGLFALAGPVAAQVRYKIPEPKIERESETTAEGAKVWKKLEADCPYCRGAKKSKCGHCTDTELPKCEECQKTGEATCRYCAGSGKLVDPLEEMLCPFCVGAGWHDCALCNSRGSYPVQGGGATEQKCGACDAKGSIPCSACKGKHLVPVVKVGSKGPGQAKAKELQAAKEKLAESLALLEAYEPSSKESQSLDEYKKAIKPASKYYAALRGGEALLTNALKGLRKGAAYTRYNEWLLNEFTVFKDRSIYALKHQILLLDLCLEYAEHNEKLESKKTP